MKYYGTYTNPRDLVPRKFVNGLVCADFNTTSNYNKNDVVVYKDSLYKAKDDITAGAWDASKWTVIENISNGMRFKSPETKTIDFSNKTSYPTITSVMTYIGDHEDEMVSLKTIYTLIQRCLEDSGRSIAGDTLTMSASLNDKVDTDGNLVPGSDVTYDSATETMIMP